MIAVGFAALALCSYCERDVDGPSTPFRSVEAVSVDYVSEALRAGFSEDGQRSEGSPDDVNPNLPAWFIGEVIDPIGATMVRMNPDRTVFGFSYAADGHACYENLRRQLEERGWITVPSGLANQATLVKGTGACRWMSMSVMEFDETSTVVMQVQRVNA